MAHVPRILASLLVLLGGTACGGAGPSDISPDPVPKHLAHCGDAFPQRASSPYILPWPVGLSFNVGQANCTNGSHASDDFDRFAYDFDMPIGTDILASRGGTVFSLEERFLDGNRTSGEENFVNVLHDDGSGGVYHHLTHDGVLVDVGTGVTQGQVIARSGDTGDSTEPHLHFQVDACYDCASAPVTFRNTRPHPDGLVEGEFYRAEAYRFPGTTGPSARTWVARHPKLVRRGTRRP